MRTRAFRPEAPARLEGRSLLSGVASPSAHPIVLPLRMLNIVAEQFREGFQDFARDRAISDLRQEISNVTPIIPFGRVDGLGVSINSIVNRMQHDLSAHVPDAITSAQNDVIAVTLAEVQARVKKGDVVVT
jgi:hypothetical protein